MRAFVCLLLLSLLVGCGGGPEAHPEQLPGFSSFVTTDDGWRLSLFRVPARSGGPGGGTPVLLVPGTAMNRHSMMFEGSDLSAILAEAGLDVWIAELRGSRTSQPPEPSMWGPGEWTVDEMIERDLPAIVEHVLSRSSHDRLFWVGHSLGGILGYAAAQGPLAPRIAGIVTLGSPGALVHPTELSLSGGGLEELVPKKGKARVTSLVGGMRTLLRVSPDAPVLHLLFNAENLDVDAAVAFARPGTEDIGAGVLAQYRDWLDAGAIRSVDGRTDYTAGLSRVSAPALVLAGRVDQLIPPWMARLGYERLGSTDKTWRVLGQGGGERHDYGHGDLLIGDWAFEEVHPVVRDWVLARAASAP